jgi:hypothetical protein
MPALLFACGETARSPIPGAAAGGTSTSAAGGMSTSAAGSDSSASGGGGAGATGKAGSNGGGASGGVGLPAPEACPGELPGEWGAEVEVDATPPPNVDACWNLQGGFSGGQYVATARWPTPKRLLFSLKLEPDRYSLAQVIVGRVTTDFAAECLATPDGTPTCEQLGAALLMSGQGQGSVRAVTCSAGAAGACSCELDVMMVGGNAGVMVDDRAARVVELATSFDGSTPPVKTRYCATAEGLRFGPEVDALARQGSQALFQPVDCVDAVRGPGEEDVDCGIVCPACVKTEY